MTLIKANILLLLVFATNLMFRYFEVQPLMQLLYVAVAISIVILDDWKVK